MESVRAAAVQSLGGGGVMGLMMAANSAPPPPPGLEALANRLQGRIAAILSSLGGSVGGMSAVSSLLGTGGNQGGGRAKALELLKGLDQLELESLLDEVVEHFKGRRNLRELRGWLGEVSPALIEALVHRRDSHMVQRLESLGKALGQLAPTGPSAALGTHRAVAVVGCAHMDGIEARWAETHGGASVQPIEL